MKIQRMKALLVLFVVGFAGCGPAASPPALIGKWRSGDHMLQFKADGTVSEIAPPTPPEVHAMQLIAAPRLNGTWVANGDEVRVTCDSGIVYTFNWTVDEDADILRISAKFGEHNMGLFLLHRDSRFANRMHRE